MQTLKIYIPMQPLETYIPMQLLKAYIPMQPLKTYIPVQPLKTYLPVQPLKTYIYIPLRLSKVERTRFFFSNVSPQYCMSCSLIFFLVRSIVTVVCMDTQCSHCVFKKWSIPGEVELIWLFTPVPDINSAEKQFHTAD